VIIAEERSTNCRKIQEVFMISRSPYHFGNERWFALMLAIAILILSLLPLVGFIASYLPPDPYALQPHLYGVFLPLLGGLIFSAYLLRTSRGELLRPLPIASSAGLVLGMFLGSIFNLPYYLGLLLIFGMIGPFMALNPIGPGGFPNAHVRLDFWLSTVAVLLSLLLYALVAFLVTRRTGDVRYGLWGALLAAFVTLLVATYTFVIIALVQAFPSPSQQTLPIVISFQYLPLQTMPLSIAQALHAAIGGFIGSSIALRCLHKRAVNAGNP
jgi:uncharacterized membrane protein YhaH (DUF805 family)